MRRHKLMILAAALLLLISLGSCSKLPEEMKTTPAPLFEPKPTIYPDETLTIILTAEEMSILESYPNLRTLDLSGSRCYDEILSYMAAHPEVETTYTVALQGGGETLEVRNTDSSVLLADAGYVESLIAQAIYLPAIRTIQLSEEAVSAEVLDRLHETYPDAEIQYAVTLLGQSFDSQTTYLDLSAATSEDLDSVIPALQKLLLLESVELRNENGESALSSSDVARLSETCPNVVFQYGFVLFGQEISTSDERIELSNRISATKVSSRSARSCPP